VLGVLKIFHIAPARIKETDMIDVIYNMIRDRDPHVRACPRCGVVQCVPVAGVPVSALSPPPVPVLHAFGRFRGHFGPLRTWLLWLLVSLLLWLQGCWLCRVLGSAWRCDGQVVANAISALNELMAEEGGLAVNKAIIHHLLNRIKDFSEWGQCLVLDLVAKYTPDAHVCRVLPACCFGSAGGWVACCGLCHPQGAPGAWSSLVAPFPCARICVRFRRRLLRS
jgi:hypothetical protein